MLETDYDIVPPDMNIQKFIPILQVSAHNTFPVVGKDGELLGLVIFSKVKELLFQTSTLEKQTMFQIMSKPVAVINSEDEIPEIVEKFERTRAFRLPVLVQGKYAGFITKGGLLSEYRREFLTGTQKNPL
jgi:CIC family chloride channel protein